MPEQAIAKAPEGVQVPLELRKIVVIGTLDTGEEIGQERELKLPKGLESFEPVANMIWSQLGGMSKTIDNYTFEYYPLDRFKKFTLKVSPLISGNSLTTP